MGFRVRGLRGPSITRVLTISSAVFGRAIESECKRLDTGHLSCQLEGQANLVSRLIMERGVI